MTFAQCAIAYRAAGKPPRFLEKIEDYWRDTPVREMTGEAVRLSAASLYPECKPATWNRQVIKVTQAVVNYGASLWESRSLSVEKFEEIAEERQPASRAWVSAFAEQAKEDGLPHLGALCLIMFGTGARISEALEISWSAVDLLERIAVVNSTKGQLRRKAHLPPPVFDAIDSLPSNRNPDDLVFGYAGRGSVYDSWWKVCHRAGIEYLTPHCCRHGFATTMLREGIDVKTVAKMGGWKDAATVLKTYAHAIEDRTVTDVLFGTNLTQRDYENSVSIRNRRGNLQ